MEDFQCLRPSRRRRARWGAVTRARMHSSTLALHGMERKSEPKRKDRPHAYCRVSRRLAGSVSELPTPAASPRSGAVALALVPTPLLVDDALAAAEGALARLHALCGCARALAQWADRLADALTRKGRSLRPPAPPPLLAPVRVGFQPPGAPRYEYKGSAWPSIRACRTTVLCVNPWNHSVLLCDHARWVCPCSSGL